MKTLLILLLACSTARATLTSLTPGGFIEYNPPPIFYWLLNTQSQVAGGNFFDPNNPTRFTWSPYEPLGDHNFNVVRTGVQNGIVTWHLHGTGFQSQFVLVEGYNGFANIYQSDSPMRDMGFIVDGSPLEAIIFYGTGPFLNINRPMKTWIEKHHD